MFVILFFRLRQPPISTLFPYTTLFRSRSRRRRRPSGCGRTSGPTAAERADPQRNFDLDEGDRKSTRLNSSHLGISYAVFCLKKKKTKKNNMNEEKTKT